LRGTGTVWGRKLNPYLGARIDRQSHGVPETPFDEMMAEKEVPGGVEPRLRLTFELLSEPGASVWAQDRPSSRLVTYAVQLAA